MVEDTEAGQPVPACPARLLVVALNALAAVEMDDPSHIWLVNPHAKSYGGAYDLQVSLHPCQLCLVAPLALFTCDRQCGPSVLREPTM